MAAGVPAGCGRAPARGGFALGLLFLSAACVVLTSCDYPRVYGAVNGSVTLRSPNSTSLEDIMWKKNKDKVIEWNKDKNRSFPPFEGRVFLNHTFGDLTINNLRPSDEDEYGMESSGHTMIRYVLGVLEPLPSPKLNYTESGGNVTFSCEIPEDYKSHRELIRYSWHCPPAQCDNSSEPTISFPKEDGLPREIVCNVSNPLFTRTSSFPVRGDPSRGRYGLIAFALPIFTWPFMKCVLKYGRNPRGTDSS